MYRKQTNHTHHPSWSKVKHAVWPVLHISLSLPAFTRALMQVLLYVLNMKQFDHVVAATHRPQHAAVSFQACDFVDTLLFLTKEDFSFPCPCQLFPAFFHLIMLWSHHCAHGNCLSCGFFLPPQHQSCYFKSMLSKHRHDGA